MPDLFDRLSTAARPYEIAVGRVIEEKSSLQDEEDDTSMDYDVKLIDNNGRHLTVEVKVHAGINTYNNKPYDTLCLEVKEYQYKHNRYVLSHWMKSNFDVMAHVDKNKGEIHLYKGSTIREWALARRHNARYSTKVKTANLTIPWRHKEAGYITTLSFTEQHITQHGQER